MSAFLKHQGKFLILFLVLSVISITEVYARLRVTSSTTANVLQHKSIRSSGATFELYCDGYYTLIERDSQGRTQVYVNTDGGSYSNAAKYRVDIDTLGLDWRYFSIYGGKYGKDSTCANVHIKMTSGQVKNIILSGRGQNNKVTSYAYLYVYGGTVTQISAASDTYGALNSWTYVYLNNMKYLGRNPISYSGNSLARIFVNTDCEFYYSSARFGRVLNPAPASLIAPDSVKWNILVARGNNARFPDAATNVTVECDQFEDNTTGTLSLYKNKLKIKNCGGWISDRDISSYSTVQIPSHQIVQCVNRLSTCDNSGSYVSRCIVCRTDFPSTYHESKYNHDDTIKGSSLSATCWRLGRTAIKHCGRCGEILTSATTVAKTAHIYGTTVSVPDAMVTAGCFSAGSTYKICKTCYHYEMVKGSAKTHTLVNVADDYSNLPKEFLKLADQVTVKPSCTAPGLRIAQYCSKCKMIFTQLVAAPGHAFTLHEEVEPTCTAKGHPAYLSCSRCSKYFPEDATTTAMNYYDQKVFLLDTLGHRFGFRSSPVISPETKIHDATCTEPAMYKDVCTRCGHISEVVTNEGEPARGHHYHIKQIVGFNDYIPMDGSVTLECDHCGHQEKDLSFGLNEKYGDTALKGYWAKSVVQETTTLPTCVDGEGIYQMSINYKGQLLRGTYQNFIPACGYLHNYGNDGICHEKHYRMSMSDEHDIVKDGMGNIYFLTNSVNGMLIEDNTTYSSSGYIVTPHKMPYYTRVGSARYDVQDPEDGSTLCYTDYSVQQYTNYTELTAAVKQQVDSFYLGTFVPISMSHGSAIPESPLVLGWNSHGNVLYYTLQDAQIYKNYTPMPLYYAKYMRTFSNTEWQPLYVPFPISVTQMENNGLQVARLNDTHMYDDDFDGTIDRVTLEFIRVTSGTLPANRPYLVRPATAKSVTLYFYSVELQPSHDVTVECSTVDQKISITGTYQGLAPGVMLANNYYAMNTTGSLQRAATETAKLNPQRWYLKIENKDGSPMQESDYHAVEVRILGNWDDDEVTGITELIAEPASDCPVYNLEGHRVRNDQPLRQGIYVENGQRIIVK